MTKRGGFWATATAIALLMAGCSAPAENGGEAPNSAARTVETPTVEQTTEPTEAPVDITAPGEVCDINSMYTIECSVKYPDIGFLNAVDRVGVDPLASMSDDEKIALGHSACDILAEGGSGETVELVPTAEGDIPTVNNSAVFASAPFSYCHAFANEQMIAPFL